MGIRRYMRRRTDSCVLLSIVMAMRRPKRRSSGQQRGSRKRRRYRRRKLQQHGKGFTPFKFYNKNWYDDMRRGFGLRSGARKSLGLI